MRLTSAGNLGIGTTAPAEKLSIGAGGGTATSSGRIKINNDGYAVPASLNTVGEGDKIIMWNSASTKEAWGLASGSMYLQSVASAGGDVGNISFYNGRSGAGTSTMKLTGDNLVGIGTTAPTTKLDVNGGTKITGDLNVTAITTLKDLNISGSIKVGGTSAIVDGNRWSISSVDLIGLTSTRCFTNYKRGIVVDSNCPTS
jgi:hypothetical protein